MLRVLGITALVGCGSFILLVVVIAAFGAAAGRNGTAVDAPPATPRSDPLVKPLNVLIRNKYAESLFTLDVTVGGKRVDGGTAPIGKKFRVCERLRIAGHRNEEYRGLFTMNRDAEVKISLGATSLGETRYFNVTLEPDRNHDTIYVDYDWDVATAAFTIGYGWR